jgi:hypothetical protein
MRDPNYHLILVHVLQKKDPSARAHASKKRSNKVKKFFPYAVAILFGIAVTMFGVTTVYRGSDIERVLQSRSKDEFGGMKLGRPLESNHTDRQKAVVDAFRHAWRAYKMYAWGKDELMPITRKSNDWFNLGLTLVDSLDTMWLMGLTEEFDEAREWVQNEMNVAPNTDVNLFETTIRVLGGLLSTYHFTGDTMFLDKAVSGSTPLKTTT